MQQIHHAGKLWSHGLQVLQKIDTLARRASGKDLSRKLSSVDDRHIKELMAESGLLRSRGGKGASSSSLQPSKSTPTTQEHTTDALNDEHDQRQQLDVLEDDTSELSILPPPEAHGHQTHDSTLEIAYI